MSIAGMSQTCQLPEVELASGDVLIADVVIDLHPVMENRVLVKGLDAHGKDFEQWLPCLEGLTINEHDRVLVQRPGNASEPIITGIVESVSTRRSKSRGVSTLNLKENESLTINDHQGRALMDVTSGAQGPTIQLHSPLAKLDVEGCLKLEADSLDFKARQGEMRLSASGDIKVDGEMIKLN